MRAILFPQRNSVSLTSLADPEPGPDEVLVEIHACGIAQGDFDRLSERRLRCGGNPRISIYP